MSFKFTIEKIMIRLYLRYFSYLIYLLTRLYVSSLRPRTCTPGTLLIIKLDAAGDYILIRNFLHSIRTSKKFEGYKIIFLGNVVNHSLANHFDRGEIDEFIWVDKTRIYWDLPYYMSIAKQIFQRYEVTIQPVFSREFLFDYYSCISGVEKRIGFTGDTININPAYQKIADRWYTRLIHVDQSELFEFTKNRIFFETLLEQSIPIQKPGFDEHQVEKIELPQLPDQFALLFPGAQLAFRRWSTKNYATICDYLHDRFQIETLIVGGKNDAGLAKQINKYSHSNPVDFTGKTALHQLPGIFSKASVLITNDTVAAHIGAAMDTPTIVLSQLNHYGRFVPYPKEMAKRHLCVIPEKYEALSEADLVHQFRNGSRVNINLITVEQIKKAIDHAFSATFCPGPKGGSC